MIYATRLSYIRYICKNYKAVRMYFGPQSTIAKKPWRKVKILKIVKEDEF